MRGGEPVHDDLPLLGGGLIDECLHRLLARALFVGMQYHLGIAGMCHQRDMVEAAFALCGGGVVDGAAQAAARCGDE